MKSNNKKKGAACPKAPAAPARRYVKVFVTNRVHCLLNQDYGSMSEALETILCRCCKQDTLQPDNKGRMRELPAVKDANRRISDWDGFIQLSFDLTPGQFTDLQSLSKAMGLTHTAGLALALNWDAQFNAPDDDDNAGEEWKQDQPVTSA